MHVEQRLIGRGKWEIWHALPGSEHALLLDLVRPYEDAPIEQLSRGYTVASATYFEIDGEGRLYRQRSPRDLGSPFFEIMRRLNANGELIRDLEDLCLYDLELICNSCLGRDNGSWHDKDVAHRLPTAPLLCPAERCGECLEGTSLCSRKRTGWEEDAQDVAECFQEFSRAELPALYRLKLDASQKYPCNLRGESDRLTGWLLHAKGMESRRLAKKIATLLYGHIRESSLVIVVCIARAAGVLPSAEDIHSACINVSEDVHAVGDILDPDGNAYLEVVGLTT